MNCPVDQTPLAMSDRQGIEIDYCPQCRGVWLDRGELDKLIERSTGTGQPRSNPPRESHDYSRPEANRYDRRDDRDDRHSDRRDDYRSHDKKHKREGFLGDLFDF